jgi:hypothetical protein
MPAPVLEVFEPLRDELVGIHARWALHRRLFGFDEARVDLLNRVASMFFGYAQSAMYLDLILALCRYTDPAESSRKVGQKPNLTLERLVNAVKAEDAAYGGGLEMGEWDVVCKWRDAHFEAIRSKRIAHNDLAKMAARFGGLGIDWPSREQVERFLMLCTDLMDKVQKHYIGCTFAFNFNAQDAERSGDKLVEVLTEFAKRHDAEVQAGQRTWAIRPPKGHFNPPPAVT